MDNFDTRTQFRCTSTNIFRKENCFGDKFNFLPYFAKKKCLKLLIDACYCFNSSSLLSRFASPILEHWPTLDDGLWPPCWPSAAQLYIRSGGERWLVDSVSGCLGLCTAHRRWFFTFQFCGFYIKVGLKKREKIVNL